MRAGGIAITATNFGPLITGLYCFGLFLGTIYSVPPLRLKRYAVAAFLIIATGGGWGDRGAGLPGRGGGGPAGLHSRLLLVLSCIRLCTWAPC